MKGRLVSIVFVMFIVAAAPVFAQSTPVNYTGVNFSPITTTTSYNYNWSTGTMTLGTASASVYSTQNILESRVSDPTPPDPNGFGTFIGTARPVRSPTGGGAVLYEQSVCADGFPTCLSDGSLTFGGIVMYGPLRGATLDELVNLQTDYYVESGCFGGGSPRFQISVSNATATHNIFVYLGDPPLFADCPTPNTWFSTENLATNMAGTRWDTSQLCLGTQINDYSGAVACANAFGYTINHFVLVTDGGWSGTNQGPIGAGQTFLFRNIQVNQITRFPR